MQLEVLLLFFLGAFFIFEALASLVLGEKEFTGQNTLRAVRIFGGFLLLFVALDIFNFQETGSYIWILVFCLICLIAGFVLGRKF